MITNIVALHSFEKLETYRVNPISPDIDAGYKKTMLSTSACYQSNIHKSKLTNMEIDIYAF